jgi:hypothetical protein
VVCQQLLLYIEELLDSKPVPRFHNFARMTTSCTSSSGASSAGVG